MKNLRTVLLLLCCWGLLPGAAHARTQQAAGAEPEAVKVWLARNAVPLKGVEAGRKTEDLQPLKKFLRGVSVVGLGEATHGTHEFFQLKHRLVEFLVKEMGYTVFLIEASQPATRKINEYVLEGKGDRDGALAGQGLWAWDTKEVTALVEWMRGHNQTAAPGRKVKFLGFDMHNNEAGIDELSAYLKAVAPDKGTAFDDWSKPLRSTGPGRQHFEYTRVSSQERHSMLSRANELVGYLDLNRMLFTRRGPEAVAAFERALGDARVIAQFADIYRRPDIHRNPAESRGPMRDFYMAANIKRLTEAEPAGTRFVVWAHNDHVGKYEVNMGRYLSQSFGAGYYALGFSFNQGGFQARRLGGNVTIGALDGFDIGPAPPETVEWQLARAGVADFLLDLRGAAMGAEVSDWFGRPRLMRSIGLGYAPGGSEPLHRLKLKETFDGLIFIDRTTRAQPNPTGLRDAWTITSTRAER